MATHILLDIKNWKSFIGVKDGRSMKQALEHNEDWTAAMDQKLNAQFHVTTSLIRKLIILNISSQAIEDFKACEGLLIWVELLHRILIRLEYYDHMGISLNNDRKPQRLLRQRSFI
jgi:hypothetical protein